jgi:hypothetical protein
MDDARHPLAAGNLFDAHIASLGLEDQSVHGVALSRRQLAHVVGRKGEGVALPLGGQRFAVGRELAANAVGIGNQEGRAQPIAQVAEIGIVHVEHLLRGGQIGRSQYVYIALAGKVCGNLQNLHAATRH